MPNPNPTIVHAAAGVSVDDVREAFYRQAPQQVWIREFHQKPLRLIVANDADGSIAQVDVHIDDDGTITFGQPVPVRVEYVPLGADADAVAASRMVYASRAESRPSAPLPPGFRPATVPLQPGFQPTSVAAHLRGRHNQKSHGNRYGPDGKLLRGPGKPSMGDKPSTSGRSGGKTNSIRQAYDALLRGESATVAASDLGDLLDQLNAGGDAAKRANLAHLNVEGYGTLFATDKPGALDRSRMPQLGTTLQELTPFLDHLIRQGVRVQIGEIDPTTLKPSQNEISGAKTGKIARSMAESGWLPGGLLVTSGDGYVVDGHHRWSGAAAVRASGARPDMTVTGLIIDRPIDEVLQMASQFATFESLEFDRTEQRVSAAMVSDRAWSEIRKPGDYTIEQWRRATLLDTGQGDPDDYDRYKLPVREPDGTINRNGVHAAAAALAGARTPLQATPQQKRAAARRLLAIYRDVLGDEPPESLLRLAGAVSAAAHPRTSPPAAEPGNPITVEEDHMSLAIEVRQRLGLPDDADDQTVLAMLDDLVGQAAQSVEAAAQNQDLATQVRLLEEQVQQLSAQIAEANAEKAAQIKASVLDEAQREGKFAPADRSKWESYYDQAPEVVTRVLASIAPGTAVPVTVHGSVGNPADTDTDEDGLPPEPPGLFPPDDRAAMAGKEN